MRQAKRSSAPVVLAVLVAAGALCGTILYADELRSAVLSPGRMQLKVDALDRTVAGLAALPDRITALEQTVAAAGKRIDQQAVSSLAVAVIAARLLRDSLGKSDAYAEDLALLRLAVRTDDELSGALDSVSRYAAQGIPTRAQLFTGFGLLVPSILRAEVQADPGSVHETVWGWVTGFSSVIRAAATESRPEATTAQPASPQPESRTPTVLASAAARLEAGDLAAAVDVMAALDGPAAAPAESWLADARARLAAERLSAVLDDKVRRWSAAGAQ